MIAIVGAGPGGTYLYRLLERLGIQAEIFDDSKETACGMKPCGWLVPLDAFIESCNLVGLRSEDYLLAVHDKVILNEVSVQAKVGIIKKKLFLSALIGNKTLQPFSGGEYDRIVDATGFTRALLPMDLKKGLVSYTHQSLGSATNTNIDFSFNHGVYSWIIPLPGGIAHFGGTGRSSMSFNQVCSCQSQIWGGGPRFPFIEGKVWGLGESIGLVSPITGAGIIPAIESARLMVECWDNPRAYVLAVSERYSYLVGEVEVARWIAEGVPPLFYAMIFRSALNRAGVYPSWSQLIHMRRAI